jgi:predicted kinase
MSGLPASGKSFRVNGMQQMEQGLFVFSTDNILQRIAEQLGKTYNDVFLDHISSATAEAEIDLAEAIKNKQNVIWDQTNLGVRKRKKIIDRMVQAGYTVECACFLPPEPGKFDDLKLWKQRLNSRPGKSIPDSVISNMYENFVCPSVQEGFDVVKFYNIHGACVGVEHNDGKQ